MRPAAPPGGRIDAVSAPQPASLAQAGAFGLRVVPHTVESCNAGHATSVPAGARSLGLDPAALVARTGLGREARPVGRARRRPAAGREARPQPLHARNPEETGGFVVCR